MRRSLLISLVAVTLLTGPVFGVLDPNDSETYPTGGYGIIICGNSIVFGNDYDVYIKQLLLEAYRAFRYNLGFDPNNLWVMVDSGADDWTEGEFDAQPATQTQIANTFKTIGQRMWDRPNVPRNLIVVVGGHGGRGLSGVATSMKVQLASGMVWDYNFVSGCINKINDNTHGSSPVERLDLILTMCYGGGLIDDVRSNFHTLRGTTWPKARHLSVLTAGDGFDVTSGLFGVYMVQTFRASGEGVVDLNGDGVLSVYDYFDHAAKIDISNPTAAYTPYIPETIYVPSNLYIPIPFDGDYLAEHPLYYEWNSPIKLTVSRRLDTQGNVNMSPAPADANSPTYRFMTPVTLTAVPAENRSFKYWEVYDPAHPNDANYMTTDANNPLTVVMSTDRQVTAVFGCSNGVGQALPLVMVGAMVCGLMARRMRRR